MSEYNLYKGVCMPNEEYIDTLSITIGKHTFSCIIKWQWLTNLLYRIFRIFGKEEGCVVI